MESLTYMLWTMKGLNLRWLLTGRCAFAHPRAVGAVVRGADLARPKAGRSGRIMRLEADPVLGLRAPARRAVRPAVDLGCLAAVDHVVPYLSAFAAASTVASMSASVWAADTNIASNGDGGRYTPPSSMR